MDLCTDRESPLRPERRCNALVASPSGAGARPCARSSPGFRVPRRALQCVEQARECRARRPGGSGGLSPQVGAAWPASSCAIAHRRGPLPAAPMPRAPTQHAPRRNAPWVTRSRAGRAGRLAPGVPVAGRKGQLTGPDRRALSGSAPPASRALPSVASPRRWAQAPTLDPGATADPAGLTARARPKARPNMARGEPQSIGAFSSPAHRRYAGDLTTVCDADLTRHSRKYSRRGTLDNTGVPSCALRGV